MIAQQRLHNPLRLDSLAICSVYRHVRLRVCLNVNFPDVDAVDAGPLTPTKQGVGLVEGIGLLPQVDPRGLEYHWLRVQRGARENSADSETAVVAAGRVSVTPIYFDRTDEGAFAVRARSRQSSCSNSDQQGCECNSTSWPASWIWRAIARIGSTSLK